MPIRLPAASRFEMAPLLHNARFMPAGQSYTETELCKSNAMPGGRGDLCVNNVIVLIVICTTHNL